MATDRTDPCLLPLVLVAALGSQSPTEPVTDPSAAAERAVGRFAEGIGEHGLAAAVWAGEGVAWSRQWGLRDKERRLPVSPETMFRIGSVSKVLTATTLGAMVAKEELGFDTRLDAHLPDLPEAYAALTPRLLAGHLAGVRHYDPQRMLEEYLSTTHYESQVAALAAFVDDPLVSEPGKEYRYSTFGYTALGAVMERAADRPLAALIRSRVFRPAGMQHSYCEHNEEVAGELAVPYSSMGGREMTVPQVDNSVKLAGAGIVSTPIDLARFLGAVCEHRLVPPEIHAEMTTPQRTSAGEVTEVGIGWRIAEDARGRRYLHHGGSSAGGRAFVLLYPEEKVGVALCMNLSSDALSFDEELALEVAAAFVD